MQVFKIFKGFDGIDSGNFFKVAENRTRGHNMKIFKVGCHLEYMKHFFSNTAVNLWNKLPGDTLARHTVQKFKAKLDKLISQRFIYVVRFLPLCHHVFLT
jgi:hypothetical protein